MLQGNVTGPDETGMGRGAYEEFGIHFSTRSDGVALFGSVQTVLAGGSIQNADRAKLSETLDR